MLRKCILLFAVLLFYIGCSSDDNTTQMMEDSETPMQDEEEDTPDESTDTGILLMIEISHKLGGGDGVEVERSHFVNDRPVRDTLFRTNGSIGYITTYEYNTDENLVKETATFYNSNQIDRVDVREFTYDGQDRIVRSLFTEDINSSNEFVSDVTFTYNTNTIDISNNFNNNYSWILDSDGRVQRDESTNGSFAQAIYSGSNLVEMDTNYQPEENYQFEFDLATPVVGGFDYKTILGNNMINHLIYNGRINDGGYEVFQNNYLTGFTYSYLLNGAPEIQNVQYTYEFDNQGRLKKRTENSEFYPARELIDYEYFYND